MAGNLFFFFSPSMYPLVCQNAPWKVCRSKVDKCLPKANHFPREEGHCLHSSCGGRARRRLTHPALEDTCRVLGERSRSRGAEMARSLRTSSRPGLLSPAPAPVSYTPSGVQNPPTPSTIIIMLQLVEACSFLKSPQPYKGSPTKSALIMFSFYFCLCTK